MFFDIIDISDINNVTHINYPCNIFFDHLLYLRGRDKECMINPMKQFALV